VWSWWNSLEAVERFSFWMFIVLIIGLVLGAVGTISTRLAGRQIDRLKAQRDAAQQAEIRQQLADTQQQLTEQRKREAAAREYRRTPPIVQVALAAAAHDKFFVEIVAENLIPFEFNYMVMTKGNSILSGIPLERVKVFPETAKRKFSSAVSVDLRGIRDKYLELKFELWSLGTGAPGAARASSDYHQEVHGGR